MDVPLQALPLNMVYQPRPLITDYRKECQATPEAMSELELMEENRKLKQKLAEAEKENDFLKKAAAFFAKETGK